MTRPGDAAAPKATGAGWRLGLELRRWLELEPERLRSSQAIANRLIDALGADDSLRGPIRDLSSRPQLLQALHGQGTSRQAAVSNLAGQLEKTYAPTVLLQLLDLMEAATGVALQRQPLPSDPSPAAEPVEPAQGRGPLDDAAVGDELRRKVEDDERDEHARAGAAPEREHRHEPEHPAEEVRARIAEHRSLAQVVG